MVKVGGTYHLFTTEMVGDPMWVKTRFGHWTSRDRLAWTRVATVRESSGEFEGKDPRAALWSPLPVWDPGERRWNLFYVAYRSMPTDGTRFLLNHAGEIWRAVSKTAGLEGIRGPFEDVGVVMQPGPDSLPWEGLQGTDSFFPWPRGRPLAGPLRQRAHRDEADHPLARRPGRGAVARRARGGAWREDNPAPIETPLHREPDRDRGARRRASSPSTTARRRTASAGPSRRTASAGSRGQGLVLQPKAGRVGEGAADAPRPRARGRGPLHALLHRLRAGAGLDAHPRHRVEQRRPARSASWSCGSER